MFVDSSRQDDIFLPLVEGIRELRQWERFLAALMARTQARRSIMLISLADAPSEAETSFLQIAAPRAAQDPPLDIDVLQNLKLQSFRTLRQGRVYAFDELLNHNDRNLLDYQ